MSIFLHYHCYYVLTSLAMFHYDKKFGYDYYFQCSLEKSQRGIPLTRFIEMWTKSFGNAKVKAVDGGILQMNIETQ